MVEFCRVLRLKGFLIGPQEELELFSILDEGLLKDFKRFQLTLSQLLCKSRAQQMAFPELFDEFWQKLFASFNAKVKQLSKKVPDRRVKQGATLVSLKNWLYRNQASDLEEMAFLGKGINITSTDLSHYEAVQIKEMARVIDHMVKNWASKPGRRKVPSKHSGQIDIRSLIRKNLNSGELINISFRKNKIQKPRLVLVCDVSKSMDMFSNFTVQLLYAFQNNYSSIESFVFGTKLYRITHLLKHQSFKKVLNQLSEEVQDWSGGTCIGQSLHGLIQEHGSKIFHGRVIFLMISDGWDTGDIKLLKQSMKFIKRRVSKLIWLNPQASKPGFEPQVEGMVAALPYIDIFQGVHDLETFKNWQKSYNSL